MNPAASEDKGRIFGKRLAFGESGAGETGGVASSSSESSLTVCTGIGATVGLMAATAAATRGEAGWSPGKTPLELLLTLAVVSAICGTNQVC
jgi:hypothetical protein